ncbi:hypothetical protein DFH09DRAFT_1077489 [Mycena vulgaris]|nr:hypothetical protein DFH09DRAFT_1077489 [Mycena vulgaris]
MSQLSLFLSYCFVTSQPVGAVANASTKAVKCLDKDNRLTKVALVDIEKAVSLAHASPLQKSVNGKPIRLFRHRFGTDEGKTLEEHAVGADMQRFVNNVNIIGQFPFRVIITTPDASGDTTFCGVMTHGVNRNGDFFLA